jgi:hypothetical protein
MDYNDDGGKDKCKRNVVGKPLAKGENGHLEGRQGVEG